MSGKSQETRPVRESPFGESEKVDTSVIRFSSEQKDALGKRGRMVYAELHGETLELLEEQTGIVLQLSGERAFKALKFSSMKGVEVAVNLDRAVPIETRNKVYVIQFAGLLEQDPPINGVTDTYPQTPADAISIALQVEKQTGVNILEGVSTWVGWKDRIFLVGDLDPYVSATVDSNIPRSFRDTDIGLLHIAIPTAATGCWLSSIAPRIRDSSPRAVRHQG